MDMIVHEEQVRKQFHGFRHASQACNSYIPRCDLYTSKFQIQDFYIVAACVYAKSIMLICLSASLTRLWLCRVHEARTISQAHNTCAFGTVSYMPDDMKDINNPNFHAKLSQSIDRSQIMGGHRESQFYPALTSYAYVYSWLKIPENKSTYNEEKRSIKRL